MAQIGQGPPLLEVQKSHTFRQTGWESSERMSACLRGRQIHKTYQTQDTNIIFFSGIRTRDYSNRGGFRVRFTPHSHWDQQGYNISML